MYIFLFTLFIIHRTILQLLPIHFNHMAWKSDNYLQRYIDLYWHQFSLNCEKFILIFKYISQLLKFWWRSKIFYTIFHQDVPLNDIRIKSVLLIKIWQSISETKCWHNKILSPEKYTSKPGTNPICRHLCAQSFSVGPTHFLNTLQPYTCMKNLISLPILNYVII